VILPIAWAKMLKVRSEELRFFVKKVFVKAGLKEEHAEEVANHLVLANLRGVDSHGVVRVQYYIDGIKAGYINKEPKIRLLRDNPSTALIDGDFCIGQYIARKATELAIEKAKENGIGAVSLVNLSHCGMLAYYGLLIASKKMAGIVFTNGPALVTPWGGSERVFGTNPLCFAFPYNKEPIILDMATTVVAGMKILIAARDGKKIPLGWALDKYGKPTTNPKEAIEGALLPFGEYKGYGIMFMGEIYSAILSGSPQSYEIKLTPYTQGGFYVQALNIESIRNYDDYLKEINKLVKKVKSVKPWKEQEEVYLPGELESRTAKKREKEGIPIDENTWKPLLKIAKEFEVEPPKTL
jgi:LDH2 family malate/lactate/ureidoglycolate dehydrogenase